MLIHENYIKTLKFNNYQYRIFFIIYIIAFTNSLLII